MTAQRQAVMAAGSGGDGRRSSLIVLVAIIAAGLVAGLQFFFDWSDGRANAAALLVTAERFEAGLAKRKAEAGAEGGGAAASGAALLTPAPATPTVIADLQKRIEDMLAAAGARVLAIDEAVVAAAPGANGDGRAAPSASLEPAEAAPPADPGAVTRITFGIDAEIPETTLADLLLSLETARPLMVIDGLTLKAPRQVSDGFMPGQDRTLGLRLTVSALAGEVRP